MKNTLLDAIKEAAAEYHSEECNVERKDTGSMFIFPIMLKISKTDDEWSAKFLSVKYPASFPELSIDTEGESVEKFYLKIREMFLFPGYNIHNESIVKFETDQLEILYFINLDKEKSINQNFRSYKP